MTATSRIDASSFLTRTSVWSSRHRLVVLGAWALVLVAAFGTCTAFPADTGITEDAPGETGQAIRLVRDRFGEVESAPTELVVFENPSLTVDDSTYRAAVEDVMAALRALRAETSTSAAGTTVTKSERIVTRTFTHYDTGLPAGQSPFVSAGRPGVSFAAVELAGNHEEAMKHVGQVVKTVREARPGAGGFVILVGGEASVRSQSSTIINQDLGRALLISLPITFCLLLLAFRGVVAALVPLGLSFVAIVVATAILAPVSHVYPLAEIYTEMLLLMGLATGIDYALFVITRFRKERARGVSKDEAVRVATSTSGKAVVFAGVTVLLAISGMFLVGNPIFSSLGLAAMVVVALAVIVSMTLLPALLGDGLDRLRVPFMGTAGEGSRAWGRISDVVLARPALFAIGVVAVLLLTASPLLTLNLGFNGARGLSDDVEAKKALVALEQNFTLGLTSPAVVVVDAGKNRNVFAADVQAKVKLLLELVAAETVSPQTPDASFGAPVVVDTNDAGDTQLLRIPLNADTGDARAIGAVKRLREDLVPRAFGRGGANALVSGAAAGNVDFKRDILARTPLVFAWVLGLSFIVLVVTFRSIVVAVKAIVLNLLSVGATYGVLVLVFQEGWLLERPLGFEATGIVESWLPLFLFSILFGLSMDYHMFVMSRIKEAVEQGSSTEEAVSAGIRATAGTITNAAAMMIAVALTFALNRDLGLKQFGFGLALAILIDATVIRSILLPASMKLLGSKNWYMPSWLRWVPSIRMAE